MEQLNIPSWRTEITNLRAPVLATVSGQKVVMTFRNEGEDFLHPNGKYKKAVVFSMYVVNEGVKRWFVRSKNLLNQIYELGPILTGIKIEYSKEGTGLDTKHTIKRLS